MNTTLFVKSFLGNNPRFIFYLLQCLDFSLHSGKSGVPGVNRNDLHEIIVRRPPLPEQTAIATVLSDTDALLQALETLLTKKRNIKQAAIQRLLAPKEGWEVRKLGDCLGSQPNYGINAASVPYDDTLPTYLRITDISEDGKYSTFNKVSVNHQMSDFYFLEEGNIVFARTGASVGKSYLYQPKDGKLVFAGFLIRLKPNPIILSPSFLKYLTQTGYYWNWVVSNSMRSGQPGLNSIQLKKFQIHLPPLHEQTRIATILTDLDRDLEALEQKIAKYKSIKTGMMQNLLTGKIRLV